MIALAGLRRQPWFWPAAASALLMVMIGALSPEFRYSIVTANLTAASFLALVAIGQMFPIASGEGGIDLSIPFVMNFCAFLAVQLITPDPWSLPLVLLIGIGFGIAVGLVNGIVVVWIRVPPIIGTLAVGFIVLTLVQLISASGDTTFADRTLTNVMRSQLFGLPIPAYVLLAVAALAMLVIWRTAYGRALLAVGQSRKAAHLSGIDVDRTVLVVFMISGGLAGLTGPLLAASVGSADLELGNPYLLASVGAVVLGGNQIAGGTATVVADPARGRSDDGGAADRISKHCARGGNHPRPGRRQRARNVGCRDAPHGNYARLVSERCPRDGSLASADAARASGGRDDGIDQRLRPGPRLDRGRGRLSRSRDRSVRSALRTVPPAAGVDRAAVDRRALDRGAGLVRRRPLPAVQRHPERAHSELVGDHSRGHRLPLALGLRQWQHPRPAGAADHLRAWRPTRRPHRDRRHRLGADGPVRRQAAEWPERCGRGCGWTDLVHRPGLWPAVELRRRARTVRAADTGVSARSGRRRGERGNRDAHAPERDLLLG